MAKFTANFSANAANVYLCDLHRRRDADFYVASFFAAGTFGGGTVTLFVSLDKGATFIPLMPSGGTAVSFVGAGMVLTNFGNPSSNTDSIQFYATLAGATSPNVTVSVYDNR